MEITTKIKDYPKTLQEATDCIKTNMRGAAQAFVGVGYYLKYIRDKHMYQEAGYIDIWEYGKGELDLSKPMISRYISINDRFSQNGNSPILLEEYKGFGYSKLSEMLTLTDEEIQAAGITETTTVARIREVKKELKEEEPEIPEQIPGQMEITDIIALAKGTNVVATSQSEELSQNDRELMIFSRFLTDIYERYMTEKQHRFIEDKNETAFIQHTIEILLPLFESKQDTASIYTNCRFAVEISPDGYIKIQDGETTVIRHWKDAVKRIQILKALGDFPDHYDTDEIFRYLPEQQGKVDCSSHIITKEMAKSAVDELEINHIEIPLEIDGIIKTVRDYYEPSYIAFRCGYNAYMAETDGAGEVLIVHRLNSKTGSPEARDIFEISIDELAQEIDSIQNENKGGCDGNCFYCTTEEDCNSKQEKREKCIYDNNRNCNLYTAHEIAIKTGITCTSPCCNRCEEKSCSVRCSYAREQKNVINSTAQSHLEEKKSDWEHDIFENDNVAYGWARSEMVERLFERLEKQKLEIENIDGEPIVGPANRKRYAFLSEDEAYVEFLRETEENKDEIDFKVSIERLIEEYESYKNTQNVINTSAERDLAAGGDNLPSPTEEIVEAEIITQPGRQTLPPAADAKETVIKNIQYNGCTGQDKDGENYTCPPRRKPCDTECKWEPRGLTMEEAVTICTECWETYVKDLIEKDRNEEITPAAGETTVIVNHDTIAEQKELPKLKNNDQRRTWIENFEEWPLWIDNKETQERYYRYVFENGDCFIIRQAYSQRSVWDCEEHKSIKKPRWTYEKEYIVRKDSEMTLSDSETSRTAMIEYLKELQKKK